MVSGPKFAGKTAPAFLSLLSHMDEALRSRILEVLRRQHIMTVATIRPDGYPQATTVKYIHDDLIVYFATAATSSCQSVFDTTANDKNSSTREMTDRYPRT